MSIDTTVVSTSTSEVDSTHSTNDFYRVDREIEEGDVVESTTTNYSGQFATDAEMLSVTDTDVIGVSHYEFDPGPPIGGIGYVGAMEADASFEDHRQTSTTVTAEQSGGYGDEETASSSTELSVRFVDEFFSESEGTSVFDGGGGYEVETTYSNTSEGTTTYTSVTEQAFTSEGNSGSWQTEYDREYEWDFHSEMTVYGYTTVVDDSGSDSDSESSGEQTFTPSDDDDPSNGYEGEFTTYGGEGNGGGEGGDVEVVSLEELARRSPAFDLMKRFMTNQWAAATPWVNVPHIVGPGDEAGPNYDFLVHRWNEGDSTNPEDHMVLVGTTDETPPPPQRSFFKRFWQEYSLLNYNYFLYLNPWNSDIPPPVDGFDTALQYGQKTSIVVAGAAIGGLVIIGGGAAVGLPGMAALGATKLTLGGVVWFVAMETGELIIEESTGIPIILSPEDIVEWMAKGLLKKGAKEGTYALTKAGMKHADDLAVKAAAEKAAKEAKEAAEKAKEAAEKAAKAAKEAAESANSVRDKLQRYLLDANHPKGKDKATWFRKALGFTQNNLDDLARQIKFDPAKAVATELTQHGQKFEQVIQITGANGKRIDVLFVWIRNNDGVVRLVTSTLGV